jgi:hypothetical protein
VPRRRAEVAHLKAPELARHLLCVRSSESGEAAQPGHAAGCIIPSAFETLPTPADVRMLRLGADVLRKHAQQVALEFSAQRTVELWQLVVAARLRAVPAAADASLMCYTGLPEDVRALPDLPLRRGADGVRPLDALTEVKMFLATSQNVRLHLLSLKQVQKPGMLPSRVAHTCRRHGRPGA